jgi:hypothetical protein
MAISEVCKIEVVQELDRLCLDKSVSRNEASKKLATFYKDVVGVDVGWQTIKKKDQRARQVGTNVPSKQTVADTPPNEKGSRYQQEKEKDLANEIKWRLDELRESFDKDPHRTTDGASEELEDLSIAFRGHVMRLCAGQSQHQLTGHMLRSLVATACLAFRFIDLSVSDNHEVVGK